MQERIRSILQIYKPAETLEISNLKLSKRNTIKNSHLERGPPCQILLKAFDIYQVQNVESHSTCCHRNLTDYNLTSPVEQTDLTPHQDLEKIFYSSRSLSSLLFATPKNFINNRKSKKYNCSGSSAFKSQRVGYQSNQKLLHHYQH